MNLDKFEKGPREIFHPEIQKVIATLYFETIEMSVSVLSAPREHPHVAAEQPEQSHLGAAKAPSLSDLDRGWELGCGESSQ